MEANPPSFSTLFGDDFPTTPLWDVQSQVSEETDRQQEECIEFFADETDAFDDEQGDSQRTEGNIELTNTSGIKFLEEDEESMSSSGTTSLPPAPFDPGDHVYQWCKVAGIPAFHHHAIVMQVHWDNFDGIWMLHVSDFSNISLYDATAAATGRRRRQRNGSGSCISSAPFPSGSNPFLKKKEPGSWRSYATPAERWHKVIYQATLWQQVTNPSAGTCTRAECDPPVVVEARVHFLQLNSATLLANKPYHWLYNNCEAAAVWCKTGKWCTLQALTFLTTAVAGQAKSTAFLAGTAAATQVTVTAPAAGIWGSWFGLTTTTQLPLLVSQPYLIPALAAYGLITVGVPAIMIHNAKREWNNITMSLNDLFWTEYALDRPEVFVEFIKHFYDDGVDVGGKEASSKKKLQQYSNKKQEKDDNSLKKDDTKPVQPTHCRRRKGKCGLSSGALHEGTALVAILMIILQLCREVDCKFWTRIPTGPDFGGVAKIARGGAASTKVEASYQLLAKFLEDKFSEGGQEETPVSRAKLAKTLSKLSSAQQTFKSLDGVAHEAYQRTHTTDDIGDTSVSGRAQRSALRLASVAEAFYACELIEGVQNPSLMSNETLDKMQVVLNMTTVDQMDYARVVSNATVTLAGRTMPILVLFEQSYRGGAGLDHGTLVSLTSAQAPTEGRPSKGRLIVILGDPYYGDWIESLRILDEEPLLIKLSSGLVTNEIASVQPTLYQTAGQLLTLLEPQLRHYNTSAVHFVGHSLAGGVASLAATMLDGSIGMPKQLSKKTKRRKKVKKSSQPALTSSDGDSSRVADGDESNATQLLEVEVEVLEPLCGLGRARSSALSLGCPPCLSSNVVAAFCTSFIYGDDIVSRTTQESINKLVSRMEQNLYGGFVGKNLGWMTDTFSLAVSSLQSHAHGSEGEEIKLSVPGKAYLVRPRRLANVCSIHEVGNLKKGGREALREALLWQMHDVLLSKSMWKHHDLESYIQGLDRVQLRGVMNEDDLERLE